MTTTTPRGWGGGGWGRSPWGAGSSTLFVLGDARAVRENVVRLTFSAPPYFSQIGDPKDAADPSHYTVTAISGVGLDGEPVRAVRPVSVALADVEGAAGSVLDVTLDRPLSQWPCVYSISARNLRSLAGIALALGATKQFYALQAGLRSTSQDALSAGRDIANPQTLDALFDPLPNASVLKSNVLGTYVPDGTGDYAADEGLTSYKKRIIRRLLAKKNGFAHLQGYGLGVAQQVKRQAPPGAREALASEAEDQIRQEPETLSVAVRVVVRGDVTIYQVRAKTRLGNANLDIPVPKS